MHALMACFALCVFVCWVVWHYRQTWRKAVMRLACTIPVAGLLLAWYANDSASYAGEGMIPAIVAYYLRSYVRHIVFRAGFLIHDNFRFWGGVVGYAAACAFSFFIIAAAAIPVLRIRSSGSLPSCGTVSRTPIAVFFICSLTCVLVFPDQLPGYSFLFERFSVFVMLGLIFWGSMYATPQVFRGFPAVAVIACMLHFCVWADCMRAFNKENEGFTPAFFSSLPCHTLGGLVYDYRFRDVSMYDNFADYFIVWRKGIATTRTIDERSFPVQRAVDTTILPPYLEWVGKHGRYDGRYRGLACILVRGEIPERDRPFFDGYQLVKRSGSWKIFQKEVCAREQ